MENGNFLYGQILLSLFNFHKKEKGLNNIFYSIFLFYLFDHL